MASTVTPISRELAEQALAAVKEQFKSYLMFTDEEYGPKLVEAWTDNGHWAICWEEGPYEWAYDSSWKVFPEGVFAEPYSYSVLCLYPA